MSAIIGSAVLYQEFRDMTFSQFVNFAFGVSPPSAPPSENVRWPLPNGRLPDLLYKP